MLFQWIVQCIVKICILIVVLLYLIGLLWILFHTIKYGIETFLNWRIDRLRRKKWLEDEARKKLLDITITNIKEIMIYDAKTGDYRRVIPSYGFNASSWFDFKNEIEMIEKHDDKLIIYFNHERWGARRF